MSIEKSTYARLERPLLASRHARVVLLVCCGRKKGAEAIAGPFADAQSKSIMLICHRDPPGANPRS